MRTAASDRGPKACEAFGRLRPCIVRPRVPARSARSLSGEVLDVFWRGSLDTEIVYETALTTVRQDLAMAEQEPKGILDWVCVTMLMKSDLTACPVQN